jgi:hypothetical protein
MKSDDVKPPERQTQTDDLACGKLINCNAKREHDGAYTAQRARSHQQARKQRSRLVAWRSAQWVSERDSQKKKLKVTCLAVKNNERGASPENPFATPSTVQNVVFLLTNLAVARRSQVSERWRRRVGESRSQPCQPISEMSVKVRFVFLLTDDNRFVVCTQEIFVSS